MGRVLSLLLVTLLCSLPLAAQNASGMLNGTVRDASGAVVPGAAVTLTNDATGASRLVRTNNDGYFSFPDLQAATYSIRIEAAGFKAYQQQEIRLNTSEKRSLGQIELSIGGVTETVVVQAAAAPVDLGSGEKAGVITGQEIDSIALRGRDFLDVLRLLPGVVDEADTREAPGPNGIQKININGGRDNQKAMMIDGISNIDTGSNGTTHTAPTLDMIAEVRVLTSNYQAEFGRSAGGTILVTTKGGTKQFHGNAGWAYRHETLNANNYFDNQNNVKKSPYRYNIFSWSLGGPAAIKNHGNSKLFFFYNQEFTRQRMNWGTTKVRVPTLLERQGDFTASKDLNQKVISVYDPQTGSVFPGNVIPADRFDKSGQAILKMFPAPNFVDAIAANTVQWNYIVSSSGAYTRRADTARVDFVPDSRWQVFARLTENSDDQHPSYNQWITGSVNYDLTSLKFNQPGRQASVNVTRSIGTSWMSQTVAGWSMNRVLSQPDDPQKINRKVLGIDIAQWYPVNNPANYIPSMTFGVPGTSVNPSMGNSMPYKNVNHVFSVTENLSKIHGTHTFRMGVYIERARKDSKQGTATRGSMTFGDDSNSPVRTRYGFASALIGIMTSYSESTNAPYALYRFSNFEWYVQDNWRVNRRLALDYGIRFYHDPPHEEIRGQVSAFVPGLYDRANAPVLITSTKNAKGARSGLNPVTGELVNQAFIGTFAPGVGNPTTGMVQPGKNGYPASLYTTPSMAYAPRFGFAYDPVGKGRTAIRGGAGIFFDRTMAGPTLWMTTNPPVVYTPTIYYSPFSDIATTATSSLLAPSTVSNSLYGKGKQPAVYNYSFGVQHAIGTNTKLDVSYVGSISRHMMWQRNVNPVPIGAQFLNLHPENKDPTNNSVYSNNFLRPYTGYGDIMEFEFGSTTNYNSLQSSLMTVLKTGLRLRASYTWAKTLGSAATDSTAVNAFFPVRTWDYGRLSFDRDHVASLNFVWGVPRAWLPSNRWLRMPIQRWEINGTGQFSFGQPFRPGLSTVDGMNFTGTPSISARPDWLGGNKFARPALPRVSGTIESPYFGNAGAGILRRPGVNNWDLRISRRFPLFSERRALEFRGELLNAFNHTQFSALNETARYDSTGSQINSLFLVPTAARRPRQIQMSLRLSF